jgi:SpoVK/Ycf46/Vps4 family AAA+-type ATPase
MKYTKVKVSPARKVDFSEIDFRYLQARLACTDLIIRRATRRWQLAGQNPEDRLRGLYITPEKASALSTRRFGANWGETATLPDEEEAQFQSAYTAASNEAQALVETLRRYGTQPRLLQIAQAFHLSDFEVEALLVCLAPALDLRYEQLYGFLQDDVTHKYASVNLILDLLCEATPQRLLLLEHFTPHAPLIEYQILQEVVDQHAETRSALEQMWSVNATVIAWLLGRYQPAEELDRYVDASLSSDEALDAVLLDELAPALERITASPALVVCYGADQMRQNAAARQIAKRLDRALLKVNLPASPDAEVSISALVKLALRDARLTGGLLVLAGCDALMHEDTLPPELLQVLVQHPDLVIMQSQKKWQPRQVEHQRTLVWIEFAVPGYQQREKLWRYFLQQASVQVDEAIDIPALAGQFILTATQIRDAVHAAIDAAQQDQSSIDIQVLFATARMQSSPVLGSQARKINPRYTWADIVLPEDQLLMLHELVNTVRERALVLGQWGLARKLTASEGVTVLFAGPPGTGKTMAAEVIASELGLDLYKIDLSTIVSKYIGETEKNLDRIFSEAESSNAILFFDEADAIFGKRSEVKDAHDRYANIEVSYLLQRMEAYNGVTVLATNLRANLDEAFTRRLQFAIDFPFPDEAYRLQIWKTLFPPEVPQDDSVDFLLMAKRFRLAGGNIRNIIVSAAYQAASNGGKVTMAHLMHGTRRELQKMGRLLNEKDLIPN